MKFWIVVITVIVVATAVWYIGQPTTTSSISVTATATSVAEATATTAPSVDNTRGTNKGRVIRLTTADIKARLKDFGTNEAKIADITLTPDLATIDLVVGGVNGKFTTGLAVANDKIVLVKPAIDGLLGAVLPVEKIGVLIQDELNKRLAEQPVKDIRIVNDAIEVVVNP